MSIDIAKISTLPDTPGVYFFKDSKGKVLYVGKATSLRDRVRSYLSSDISLTRGPKIVHMLSLSADVDVLETDSVLEALILEANLIKKHQPPANSQEKDNKSFNYVVFTNDAFPKILVVRGRILFGTFPKEDIKYIFGPFPHGSQLREAMKIIRRMFPYRDNTCVSAEEHLKRNKKPRPCFNRQIGLCPGVCTGEVSTHEYAQTIRYLKLFFEGKKKEVVQALEKDMNTQASLKEFEKARNIKKTIFALTHIQDVGLLKRSMRISESVGGEVGFREHGTTFRVEGYDVAHFSGKQVVGVMTVIENGEPVVSEYRKFVIKENPGVNDTGALREILHRRLKHLEWHMPDLIVVDGGRAQKNIAEKVIKDFGFSIDVVAVVKDEKHKPRTIMGKEDLIQKYKHDVLLVNSEAHRFAIAFHRKRRNHMIY